MRRWRTTLFAVVLMAALVGLANGHVGSGLFWGLLAALALAGELIEGRTGVRATMIVVFGYGVVLSLLLAGVTGVLIVRAVLAPSAEERNPYIGMAVLVGPIAAMACWATVAGYRLVRQVQRESHAHRPAWEVYAELVANAQQEAATPDPQRKTRQRRMGLFLGISGVGWVLGRIVGAMDEGLNGAVSRLLVLLSLLLMFGGLLAAGWTSVWVFKDRSGSET
jgi:hypothetical protein